MRFCAIFDGGYKGHQRNEIFDENQLKLDVRIDESCGDTYLLCKMIAKLKSNENKTFPPWEWLFALKIRNKTPRITYCSGDQYIIIHTVTDLCSLRKLLDTGRRWFHFLRNFIFQFLKHFLVDNSCNLETFKTENYVLCDVSLRVNRHCLTDWLSSSFF